MCADVGVTKHVFPSQHAPPPWNRMNRSPPPLCVDRFTPKPAGVPLAHIVPGISTHVHVLAGVASDCASMDGASSATEPSLPVSPPPPQATSASAPASATSF